MSEAEAGEASRREPANLEDILDELAALTDHINHDGADHPVSVDDVMAAMAQRSFGPLLLVPSLIGLSPIGAIPGLPAVMVVVEICLILQMLMGWKQVWLPGFVRRRAISARRFARGLEALRRPARFVDGFIRPRMEWLTRGAFFYVIALTCLAVALVTPVLELVPMLGIPPNAAVVAFSLAITARDGLWALTAFAFTAGCGWLLSLMW